MKIGKNHITGIYRYATGCIPDRDDIVLYDGYLWVCQKTATQELPRVDSPDWRMYQAPNIATKDQVLEAFQANSLGDAQWMDYAIPLRLLPEIFDTVYHGMSGKGVIGGATESSISKIIGDTSHPYGIYAFKRDHTDVEGLVKQVGMTTEEVFLKKFTYTTNGIRYLLLELSDYEDGSLWYKVVTDIKENTNGQTGYRVLSEWKIVSPSDDIKGIINRIVNQYNSRLNNLRGIESNLRDNFRWTKLSFPGSNTGILSLPIGLSDKESRGSDTTYPILPNASELDFTVVVLLTNPQTGVSFSESVTFPGANHLNVRVPMPYVSELLTVCYSITPNSSQAVISLQGVPSGYTGGIVSVYYQDFYGTHLS